MNTFFMMIDKTKEYNIDWPSFRARAEILSSCIINGAWQVPDPITQLASLKKSLSGQTFEHVIDITQGWIGQQLNRELKATLHQNLHPSRLRAIAPQLPTMGIFLGDPQAWNSVSQQIKPTDRVLIFDDVAVSTRTIKTIVGKLGLRPEQCTAAFLAINTGETEVAYGALKPVDKELQKFGLENVLWVQDMDFAHGDDLIHLADLHPDGKNLKLALETSLWLTQDDTTEQAHRFNSLADKQLLSICNSHLFDAGNVAQLQETGHLFITDQEAFRQHSLFSTRFFPLAMKANIDRLNRDFLDRECNLIVDELCLLRKLQEGGQHQIENFHPKGKEL